MAFSFKSFVENELLTKKREDLSTTVYVFSCTISIYHACSEVFFWTSTRYIQVIVSELIIFNSFVNEKGQINQIKYIMTIIISNNHF